MSYNETVYVYREIGIGKSHSIRQPRSLLLGGTLGAFGANCTACAQYWHRPPLVPLLFLRKTQNPGEALVVTEEFASVSRSLVRLGHLSFHGLSHGCCRSVLASPETSITVLKTDNLI